MVARQSNMKITRREHVEDIWLADHRLKTLAKQWFQAVGDGDTAKAENIRNISIRIKKEILSKYEVILEGIS